MKIVNFLYYKIVNFKIIIIKNDKKIILGLYNKRNNVNREKKIFFFIERKVSIVRIEGRFLSVVGLLLVYKLVDLRREFFFIVL